MKRSFENFKAWCHEKNFPYNRFVSPLDRLLLKMGFISNPIILWPFWRSAILYSFIFTFAFTITVELVFRTLFDISPAKVLPAEIKAYCIGLMITFGPFMGLIQKRAMKKYQIPPREHFEK